MASEVRYWLCCGSKVFQHGEKTCYEALSGRPERCRYGTAKEHGDWQRERSSNAADEPDPTAEPTCKKR